MRKFEVHAHWDPEVKRWWTTSEDIRGLATEADTFEELLKNILEIAPILLEENGILLDDDELEGLPITIMAERLETVRIAR